MLGVALGILATSVVALATREITRGEPIVLRYRFAAGQQRTYELTMDVRGRIDGLPASAPFDTRVTGRATSEVVDVAPDGTARMRVVYSGVRAAGTAGALPASPGGAFTMRVSPTGEVTDVRGSSGLIPSGAGNPFAAFGASGAGPADPFGSVLFTTFPRRPVAPGDSWTESQDVPLPFGESRSKTRTDGTFQDVVTTRFGRAATIRQRTTTDLDASFSFAELFEQFASGLVRGLGPDGGPALSPPPELRGATMRMDGSMRGETVNRVLRTGGDVVDLEGDVDLDFDVRVVGIPGRTAPGIQRFRMRVETATRIVRVA